MGLFSGAGPWALRPACQDGSLNKFFHSFVLAGPSSLLAASNGALATSRLCWASLPWMAPRGNAVLVRKSSISYHLGGALILGCFHLLSPFLDGKVLYLLQLMGFIRFCPGISQFS